MEIIPVLDVMHGKAVSGKSGERKNYLELKTVFASSSNPIEIAKNIPYERLYIADLDGIMHGEPDLKLLEELSKIKKLLVDAGIRSYKDFEKLSRLNADIIIGTETLEDLETLKKALKQKKVTVSIDIKEGKVLSNFLPENPKKAFEVLRGLGVKKFILLNISAVGTLSGFLNIENLRSKFSDVQIMVGGGIRKGDLKKLEKIGAHAVLVGTALHRGLI